MLTPKVFIILWYFFSNIESHLRNTAMSYFKIISSETYIVIHGKHDNTHKLIAITVITNKQIIRILWIIEIRVNIWKTHHSQRHRTTHTHSYCTITSTITHACGIALLSLSASIMQSAAALRDYQLAACLSWPTGYIVTLRTIINCPQLSTYFTCTDFPQ